MRFVAKYARFDNWDDQIESPNGPEQGVYESKMNRANIDAPSPIDAPPPSIDDLPGGGNVDFMRDSGEDAPPF